VHLGDAEPFADLFLGEVAVEPEHEDPLFALWQRLAGKAAVITGADSGIGRAVAIAFAREAPTCSSLTSTSTTTHGRPPAE
jgi:hypothetical protein